MRPSPEAEERLKPVIISQSVLYVVQPRSRYCLLPDQENQEKSSLLELVYFDKTTLTGFKLMII